MNDRPTLAEQLLGALLPADLTRITVRVPISDRPLVHRIKSATAGQGVEADRIEPHTGFTSSAFPGLAVIAFTHRQAPTTWSTTHIETGMGLFASGETLEANLVFAVLAGRVCDWSRVHVDGHRAVHEDPSIDPASVLSKLRGGDASGIPFVLGEPDYDGDADIDLTDCWEDGVRALLDEVAP